MKKLLALVLALVMTLGLATVGASAATVKYADKNDIDFSEAADVLSAVGVFQGKGDNFAPKDNLNRAEAAKLVAYLMLGTKTAEAIKGNGNRFVDVPADHWAVGYIEYLATAGVVSGVGDNKFNPNGPVTAVQFAKMLNVALGYDAQVEGYVGNSWNINIMKQANDDDIFKGLSSVGSNDTLTREQAAQMCLNALKADTVEYESKGDTLTINNSTVVLNAKKAKDKTTTDTKGNAIKNDDATGTVANPYKLQLGEDLYNGDLKKDSTRDDFGRPASKWTYKNEKIGTYVDTSDLKAEYTAEIKSGPIYDLLGSSVYDHLVLANNARDYATLHYFEDGVPYGNTTDGLVNSSSSATTNKAEVEKFVLKNGDKAINYDKGTDAASSGNGSLTQVFIDKNDNVTITVVNTYVFKASSDYRASTEDVVISVPTDAKNQTVASIKNGRLELNDFPEIKDIKKDDYLLITAYKDGSVYTAKTVAKAEKLTATVDKVVKTDSVTLDGEKKEYNKTATKATKETEFSVGQEATVVLDKYGYIVYIDESVVANNYVFISELYQNGGSTTKVQANAYFTDGTNKTITIKELDKNSTKSTLITATADPAAPAPLGNETMAAGVTNRSTNGGHSASIYAGWYTYTKNAGDEYTLTSPTSSYTRKNEGSKGTLGDLTYSDAVAFINGGITVASADAKLKTTSTATPKANNKTIMVVAYGDKSDVDVYTGVNNLPDIKLSAAASGKADGRGAIFTVMNSDYYAKYVFVTVEGNYSVFGSENENLLYVIKHDKTNVEKDNKNYFTYKVLDENAKEITVEAENDLRTNTTTSNIYQAFYKTSKNADGRYTRIEAVPAGSSGKYINKSGTNDISADGETLTIAGESFTLADDFKLVVVSRVDALNKKNTTINSGFEANVMTAEGLEATLKNFSYTYDVQAKLKDTYAPGKNKLVEAYVTIKTATATTGSGSTSTTNATGVLAVVLPDGIRGISKAVWNKQPFDVYYGGTAIPTTAAISKALEAEFAKYSELGVTSVKYNTTATQYDLFDKDGANAGYLDEDGGKVLQATLTSGSSWSIDSDKTTQYLVVPQGVTLTVSNKAKLNITGKMIVNGTVYVDDATVTGATVTDVLKSGHVEVLNGGTYASTATNIEGKSFVTDSNIGNYVNLGTAKSSGLVDIKGGTVTGNLTSFGETKFSGNTTLKTMTVDTKNGTTSVAKDVTFDTGVTLKNDGGTVTVSSDAKGSFTADVDAANPITVGTTTVTSDGDVPVKTAAKTGTINVTGLTGKLTVTAISGLSRTSTENGAYTISSDTTTASITVAYSDNSEGAAETKTAQVSVTPPEGYTVKTTVGTTVTTSTDVNNGGSATFNFTVAQESKKT